jgi:hypothetical protein
LRLNRPLEKHQRLAGEIFDVTGTLLDSTLAPKPALALHTTLIQPRHKPTDR